MRYCNLVGDDIQLRSAVSFTCAVPQKTKGSVIDRSQSPAHESASG